jgi:hypothetical protein
MQASWLDRVAFSSYEMKPKGWAFRSMLLTHSWRLDDGNGKKAKSWSRKTGSERMKDVRELKRQGLVLYGWVMAHGYGH